MTPPSHGHLELDAGVIAMVSLLRTCRPSALARVRPDDPLFGVLATPSLVIGEPIGGRLVAAAFLVAGAVVAATVRIPFAIVPAGDRSRPARRAVP